MSGKIISVRELLVESFQIKILTILPLPHIAVQQIIIILMSKKTYIFL
jgi:hypothetical protein